MSQAEPPPIELGAVSIQWLADPGLCPVCNEVVGSGPVGYSTDEPAGPRCDVCLLKEDKGLGMLLWMVDGACCPSARQAGDRDE